MHRKGPLCFKMQVFFIKTNGCFRNQSGNENKNKTIWLNTHFIDWNKKMAQNWATHKKQNLERGDCAQRKKSILLAMRNRDLIGFQLGYTSYVLKTFRTFCLLNETLPIGLCRRLSKSSWAQTIMLDAVVRFIPSFAWTALSGFSPPGYPFLPKSPLRVFNLPGVQFFSFITPNFCPNLSLFLGSPGYPFFAWTLYSFLSSGFLSRSIF